MLLAKLLKALRAGSAERDVPRVELPLEVEDRLSRLHARAPVRAHLDILYGDLTIDGEGFPEAYFRCLRETGTSVTPFNVFQRFQTRHDLVRYFLATLDVPGAAVECGAYRGATALLLCRARAGVEAGFRGAGLYLVDSFSGTGASTPADFIPVRGRDGAVGMEAFFPVGKSDATPELVRTFFSDFPQVTICSGWVPDVFDAIAEERFAFVHIDLTLYEATRAALEYFHPRLAQGGVILCDGSIFCPGVEKAVERFASERDVPYAVLGHRQYAFLAAAKKS